ncbi:hypothetical protein ACFPYJ_11325 [Paenibacillus solisilvae]|uniref:ArlS sensor domain-containing protein n=1 Tax=Paenibacillus solisilvae TaxID=2486751 RepID=A0ABW0VV46_9BACL
MKGRIWIVSTRLPLKVKLVLAAAVLIFGLFIVYNFVQFLVLRQWMLNREETSIHQMMTELQDHFSNSLLTDDSELLDRHKRFIESINQNNQLIRVLDGNGNLLLAVNERLPYTWVPPETVTRTQWIHATYNGDRLLVLRSPLSTDQFKGTIEIVDSLDTFGRLSDMMLIVMLAGGVISVAISGLGGWISLQSSCCGLFKDSPTR